MTPAGSPPRVLHVIVGHGLPVYFLNAVRSVRAVAPGDDLLVVDNASPDPALRRALVDQAAGDDRCRLLLREANELERNGKVGGLYQAYREAFAQGLEGGYDYLHLLQGDMQLLWWDEEVVARAGALFAAHPCCVNLSTFLQTANRRQSDQLVFEGGAPRLRHYGLTDTGLYHLGRWQAEGLAFADSESEHGAAYLARGFEVRCHPWPTDAQIPWPAVVRAGLQRGREVRQVKPFLLRPLSPEEVTAVKGREWTWLEEACVPWGWSCLTPMWTTDLETADYWAARRQDARARGVRAALPRWERRGLEGSPGWAVWAGQHRPSLVRLCGVVPAKELARRLGPELRRLAGRRAPRPARTGLSARPRAGS